MEMKVGEDQFDALLGKLKKAPPKRAKSIGTDSKPERIIPAIPPPQSTLHKV
jgi:hypothetical protein